MCYVIYRDGFAAIEHELFIVWSVGSQQTLPDKTQKIDHKIYIFWSSCVFIE